MEYQIFLYIFQKKSAMATLGLKEMEKFLWKEEVRFYMKKYGTALLNCMPQFLANSFLGLNYISSVQTMYIYLNLIDLSKKNTFFSI